MDGDNSLRGWNRLSDVAPPLKGPTGRKNKMIVMYIYNSLIIREYKCNDNSYYTSDVVFLSDI